MLVAPGVYYLGDRAETRGQNPIPRPVVKICQSDQVLLHKMNLVVVRVSPAEQSNIPFNLSSNDKLVFPDE